MAIRDHFRLDVLVAHAAKLQDVDAELGIVERLLRMEDGGAAGTCPSCGALYPRGAAFCSLVRFEPHGAGRDPGTGRLSRKQRHLRRLHPPVTAR